MTQYLQEFCLRIEEIKSTKRNQPFVFGPSRQYLSETLVELPVLVTKLDGHEDVLVIHTYLVDAEVPFLCGKQTLEKWNFTINGKEKVLELESKLDGSKMQIKMVDTNGGYYAIVLDTRKTPDSHVLFLEDESQDIPILLLEDKKGDLCSFKSVRKVHKSTRKKERIR